VSDLLPQPGGLWVPRPVLDEANALPLLLEPTEAPPTALLTVRLRRRNRQLTRPNEPEMLFNRYRFIRIDGAVVVWIQRYPSAYLKRSVPRDPANVTEGSRAICGEPVATASWGEVQEEVLGVGFEAHYVERCPIRVLKLAVFDLGEDRGLRLGCGCGTRRSCDQQSRRHGKQKHPSHLSHPPSPHRSASYGGTEGPSIDQPHFEHLRRLSRK
jgi:hypothetical protein